MAERCCLSCGWSTLTEKTHGEFNRNCNGTVSPLFIEPEESKPEIVNQCVCGWNDTKSTPHSTMHDTWELERRVSILAHPSMMIDTREVVMAETNDSHIVKLLVEEEKRLTGIIEQDNNRLTELNQEVSRVRQNVTYVTGEVENVKVAIRALRGQSLMSDRR